VNIKKLFKKETIAESAGIVLFFTIAQRMLLTGKGIVFARILGPANFGVYSIALFFIPIVAAFARLGMPSCYPRYVPQYEKQGMMKHFIIRTYLITFASTVALTIFLLLFVDQVSSLVYDSVEHGAIIIICALSLFPLTLFETIRFTYNGLRVFKLSYLMVFTQTLVFAILGITLVFIYKTPEVVILSILLSNVIVVAIFGIIIWKYALGTEAQARNIQETGFYKKIFKYSIWFVISPIIFSLFKFTDKWMINQFIGAGQVGLYAVASNLTSLVYIFGVIAGKVLMPNLSNLWEQGEKAKAVSIMDLTVRGNTLLLIGASLVVLLLKDQVIHLLFGSDYIRAASVVGSLLIFWMLNCVYLIISGYAGLIEKTYIPLVGGAIGMICNVILNYMLIPHYLIQGAAIATTSSFAVTVAILLIWFRVRGLKLKANTIIICLLPCIFFLNEIVVSVICAALAAMVFGTNLLITKEERKRLSRQVGNGIRNFRNNSTQ
jgi:O-antigen/teichoic acid export membrane protein